MSSGQITLLVIVVLIVIFIFYMISMYNNLVALKNRFKNAWEQIDVQLKRRYDLIPNLVETSKAYLKHERGTLEAVIAARNGAASANEAASADPGDAAAVKTLIGAEAALTGAMGKFFALSEAYPDLKANQTMANLTEELSTTENKIAFSRQGYNDSLMTYHTAIESFPSNLIANKYNFRHGEYWKIEKAEEREAIKVSFD